MRVKYCFAGSLGNTVPDNPNSWGNLLPPWAGGLLMAVVMSALRIVYDKEETSFTRILLESLICGGLTLSTGSALVAMGYGPGWYLFCGGMIGFMGSQFIRATAKKLIRKETED